MPRPNRICFPGAVYHIFQRGNNKAPIFLEDIDNWYLLKLFLEAKARFDYLLHCYVLMKNHFHLTVETPGTDRVSDIMQFVNYGYVSYFNKKYNRIGHLFQSRFRDIIVEKDSYLLELSRYVHLNPVRAGLVALPEQYKWSSYCIYIGTRKDKLVDTNTLLSYFDMADKQRAYKDFIEDSIFHKDNESDWLDENITNRRFLSSKNFARTFNKKVPASSL